MLTKDKEISPQEFAEIQTFAQFSYGKNLALYHLSFKARTEKEVRDYLVKHEIDEKIIPQVIQASRMITGSMTVSMPMRSSIPISYLVTREATC